MHVARATGARREAVVHAGLPAKVSQQVPLLVDSDGAIHCHQKALGRRIPSQADVVESVVLDIATPCQQGYGNADFLDLAVQVDRGMVEERVKAVLVSVEFNGHGWLDPIPVVQISAEVIRITERDTCHANGLPRPRVAMQHESQAVRTPVLIAKVHIEFNVEGLGQVHLMIGPHRRAPAAHVLSQTHPGCGLGP